MQASLIPLSRKSDTNKRANPNFRPCRWIWGPSSRRYTENLIMNIHFLLFPFFLRWGLAAISLTSLFDWVSPQVHRMSRSIGPRRNFGSSPDNLTGKVLWFHMKIYRRICIRRENLWFFFCDRRVGGWTRWSGSCPVDRNWRHRSDYGIWLRYGEREREILRFYPELIMSFVNSFFVLVSRLSFARPFYTSEWSWAEAARGKKKNKIEKHLNDHLLLLHLRHPIVCLQLLRMYEESDRRRENMLSEVVYALYGRKS